MSSFLDEFTINRLEPSTVLFNLGYFHANNVVDAMNVVDANRVMDAGCHVRRECKQSRGCRLPRTSWMSRIPTSSYLQ